MNDHSSQRSRSPTSSRSPIEEESEIPCGGDLLLVRRMLGQVLKPFDESQRENIFHTRCLINDRLCSLIVDGGKLCKHGKHKSGRQTWVTYHLSCKAL